MARAHEGSGVPGRVGTDLRAAVVRFGRRYAASLQQLVTLSAQLDESGEWALDGAPTCAHWIASALDVEVATAREWIRIGRCLSSLPAIGAAFAAGELSFTKVRSLTRLATADNEAELLEIACRTPAGALGRTLAAWSARNEAEQERHRRHRRQRSLRWRVEPDGLVAGSFRLTPEQAAVLIAAVDSQVMRSDGRETTPLGHDGAPNSGVTERGEDATALRGSRRAWSSLAQQRADALVDLLSGGGAGVAAEVILHVRGDGCTLDDGTPIAGSVVERIAGGAALRAMIHDAEGRPINVSGRHRRHTDRQKRVVKERDRQCVDCGGHDFLEYDHVPAFETSGRTLVDESELRCARCHRLRHVRTDE